LIQKIQRFACSSIILEFIHAIALSDADCAKRFVDKNK